MFSWIHVDDVRRAICFIQDTPSIDGSINLAAPNPVQNRELMRTIREVLCVKAYLPAFGWMLTRRALRAPTLS